MAPSAPPFLRLRRCHRRPFIGTLASLTPRPNPTNFRSATAVGLSGDNGLSPFMTTRLLVGSETILIARLEPTALRAVATAIAITLVTLGCRLFAAVVVTMLPADSRPVAERVLRGRWNDPAPFESDERRDVRGSNSAASP